MIFNTFDSYEDSYKIPVDPIHSSECYMNHITWHSASFAQELTSYDVSFLTQKQVTIDGDVESNPGPVTNNVNTPSKGRRKKRNFTDNLTPKKLKIEELHKYVTDRNSNIDFRITPVTTLVIKSCPLGLMNYAGHNVCFFNSVIQVLYSIIPFREYVCQMETTDFSAFRGGGAVLKSETSCVLVRWWCQNNLKKYFSTLVLKYIFLLV